MIKQLLIAGIGAALLFLNGCIALWNDVPGIKGRVIDEQHHPVPNATVLIIDRATNRSVVTMHTDSDGAFRTQPQNILGYYIMGDPVARIFDITAHASGNRRSATTQAYGNSFAVFPFWFGDWDKANLGELQLLSFDASAATQKP